MHGMVSVGGDTDVLGACRNECFKTLWYQTFAVLQVNGISDVNVWSLSGHFT